MSDFTAAARQIVGKPTPTAFGQNQQPELRCTFASAEGVGALLARDLLRSGSKFGACGASGGKASSGSTAAARQIVGKPTPTASGQNQKPEQRCTFASPTAFGQNQKPELRCTFASAEGVGALLARDLLRSGSKFGACGVSGGKASSGSTAAARQIVGKPTPTASGQNPKA
ncbi:hypothetical protein ACIQAL_30610 [Pseudomonas sp. NPDC088368]|uniref:hypothetical protein n=1 Tax=Pseudomonas sp. NPDC088368 TaxID=3364453 RepID=UPI00380EB8F4